MNLEWHNIGLISSHTDILAPNVLSQLSKDVLLSYLLYKEVVDRLSRQQNKKDPVHPITTYYNEVNLIGVGDFIEIEVYKNGKFDIETHMARKFKLAKQGNVEKVYYYSVKKRKLVSVHSEDVMDITYRTYHNIFMGSLFI